MQTATLGGLIKDYRLKKRLSQLEVSLSIGWSDTTRLSKIEQGRVGKPTRETIEKIIKALDLTEQEKGEFLLIGGYAPSDEEIKQIVKEIGPKIDSWAYPAYLMDFTWRVIYTNKSNIALFNMDLSWVKKIEKEKPSALMFSFLHDIAYPVKVEKGENKEKLKPFTVAQVATFKTENHQYQNESWYKKLVAEMMKFEEFRQLWSKINRSDYHKRVYDYEYKRITGVYDGKEKSFDFHIFTAKVINDPRFQEVLYFPANKESEEICTKLKKT